MDNEPMVIERVFNAAPSTVWKAITVKDENEKMVFRFPYFYKYFAEIAP